MRSTAFFGSSQDIVKKFLSNVVAIDDKLSFKGLTPEPRAEVEDDFDAVEDDASGLGTINSSKPLQATPPSSKQSHELDYQDLSLAFAEYGINCSGFIPDPQRFKTIDNAADKIMESVRRADITILDWDMDDGFTISEDTTEVTSAKPNENLVVEAIAAGAAQAKKGSLAKASIKKILEQDQSQNGRLRLIVVYTAEPDRAAIAEDIRKLFPDDAKPLADSDDGDGCSITFTTSGLEFCKIVVIEKKPSAGDLREEVLALFTELTTGLLSNATLSALGELRDNTHHILHTFNKHLDPAYMSHVLGLLSSPDVREKAHEVAFDYATDLISEEFKSSLQINENIKSDLNNERLKDWVDFVCKTTKNNTIGIKIDNNNPIQITPERLKGLLAVITPEQLEQVLTLDPRICSSAKKFKDSRIEIDLQGVPGFHHENLCAIECKRRDINSVMGNGVEPTIKLGSIIQQGEKYYICMQPLCDTVRLREECNFIFLEITNITDEKKFSHVIKKSSSLFLKFDIKPDSKKLHVFTFSPDKVTNTIKAVEENGILKLKYKKHSGETGEFIWLGELKNNIAQSIANSLSAQISRVGLDTNEWLRKQ